jgi:hypothetical protein
LEVTSGGNSVTCTEIINIDDTTDPFWDQTMPADTTINCNGLPSFGTITASDICDNEVTIDYQQTGTYDKCGGVVVRTWIAADDCSNIITHVQTITINPATLPTMTSPGPITVACGAIPDPSTLPYSNGLSGNCEISGTSFTSNISAIQEACGGQVTRPDRYR